jgi:hypothetical protein
MARTSQRTAEATEAVRAAVEYLDEEERWLLLQRWLEKETAGMSKAANRSLRLEALRSIVCPRVGDREWDDIVREHRTVLWSNELRRANALALGAGGLSRPVPGNLSLQSGELSGGGPTVVLPDGYVAPPASAIGLP